MLNYPRVFCLLSILILWLAAQLGAYFRRARALKDEDREDFSIVQTATLTLLGLIIGFSFSMAIARYDLRKTYEEAEANAIGTEYVRAGLLPLADAAQVRVLLKKYTDLRISFYRTRNDQELQQINADTSQLQTQMWSLVQTPALAQPTPVIALAVSGMNDVLNSQGYTQAAWWNRIPDTDLDADDGNCDLQQSLSWLRFAQRSYKDQLALGSADSRLHLVSPDSRHR